MSENSLLRSIKFDCKFAENSICSPMQVKTRVGQSLRIPSGACVYFYAKIGYDISMKVNVEQVSQIELYRKTEKSN